MAIEALHPLVPEDIQPEACRRLGCTFAIFSEGVSRDEHGEITFNLLHQDQVAFGHTHDGRTSTFLLSMANLNDLNYRLWDEIVPWMTRLHEDSPRPEMSLGLD